MPKPLRSYLVPVLTKRPEVWRVPGTNRKDAETKADKHAAYVVVETGEAVDWAVHDDGTEEERNG